MGKVIPMPQRRAAAKSDTAVILADLMDQEASGELEGSILIATTKRGTEFHLLGGFAERMQLGVLALVKGLDIVTDKIVAIGNVGNTKSGTINAMWEAPPKRRTPKRLIEDTQPGALEQK